jgi:hypothetical protein
MLFVGILPDFSLPSLYATHVVPRPLRFSFDVRVSGGSLYRHIPLVYSVLRTPSTTVVASHFDFRGIEKWARNSQTHLEVDIPCVSNKHHTHFVGIASFYFSVVFYPIL